MSCKFINNIETGEKERSISYDRTHNLIGNTDLAVRIHKQFQTPYFKKFFGDWVTARNEYMQGKHSSPEESFRANEVSLMVNSQFEPYILFYSSSRSDLTPANLNYLGVLELSDTPEVDKYNYPVVVSMYKETDGSVKETPSRGEVLVTETLSGRKIKVNGEDVMSIFPSGSEKITIEQRLETAYPEDQYTPGAFENLLYKKELVNIKPKKDAEGWIEVKRSKDDKKYDEKFVDGRHYETTLMKNVAGIQNLNYYFHERVGIEPYDIVQVSPKTYKVRVSNQPPVFNRSYEREYAPHNLNQIVEKLSARTGVPYELIDYADAEKMLEDSPVKYNGEPGFFYKGKIYFVKSKVGPETALHEFAHPFVIALRQLNPELYGNILDSLVESSDPFVQNTIQYVQENYPEYTEEEKNDELIVRVMTGYAQEKIVKERSKIGKLIDKILFFIKQQLRRMFSDNTIDLSKLSVNTSIEELSKILYNGTNNIKLTSDFSTEVSPLFNREMAEKIDKAIERSHLIRKIEVGHEVFRRTVGLMEHKHHYDKLVEAIKSDRSEGTIAEALLLQLQNLDELKKDVDKNFNLALGIARTFVGLDVIMDKIVKHSNDVMNDKNLTNIEKGKSLIYYSYIVNEWSKYMDEFKRDFRSIPDVGKVVGSIEKNMKDFYEIIGDVVFDAATDFYVNELQELQKEAVRYFGGEIERLKKIYDEGDGGRLKPGDKLTLQKIKKNEDYLQRFNYTKENIQKYMRGEYGDTNIFSYLFEAYASSPNPLVQSFTNFVNKQFYIVEDELQRANRVLADNFNKIYSEHGLSYTSTQIGEKITFVDQVAKRIQGGEIESFEVRTFLNPFGNGYRYWYTKLKNDRDNALKGDNDQLINETRKKYRDFVSTFMHDVYKPEIYQLKEYWEKDDITKKAYSERKKITSELSQLNNSLEEWNEVEMEEMQRLVKKLHYLASEYDESGKLKSDEDRAIAKAIKGYYEVSRQYYKPVEIKGLFESSRAKYEDHLLALGFTPKKEGDPDGEYEKRMNAWFKKNTRIKLSDTFYEKRKKISEAIDEIMSKYPDILGNRGKISDIWEEIIDIVRDSRDTNGQPIGNQMTDAKLAKLMELEDKIENIKEEFYNAEKLDKAEREELSYLQDLKRFSTLTPEQEQRMNDLLLASGKMLPGDRATLLGLFDRIKDLQARIPSEYYIDTINEKLMESGIDYIVTYDNVINFENESFITDIKSKAKNDIFTKWFDDNHRLSERWNKEGRGLELYYKRGYAWNRIVPNDKSFIADLTSENYQRIFEASYEDVRVEKANWFYDYKVNDQYRTGYDPKTGKVELIVGEHVDTKGHWLPRMDAISNRLTIDGQDLNFRNEEYFRLKNSNDKKEQGLFKILEEYKRTHLNFQKDNVMKSHNLYLDVPRVRKQSFEVWGDIINNPAEKTRSVMNYLKDTLTWKPVEDDFDRGIIANDKEVKRIVLTDFAGNEIMRIPVRHTSMLSVDQVSLDIGHSIMKYGSSLLTAKRMYEISPINQMLMDVSKSNSPIDVAKESNWNLKVPGMVPGVRMSTNRVYDAMKNIVDKNVYGIENIMEIGMPLHKYSQVLMRLAAWGSLALNLPRGLVNHVVGMNQNIIESVSGINFTTKEIIAAEGRFMTDFLKPLVESYNVVGSRKLEAQMMEIFDPIMGRFQEMAGTEYSNRYLRDIASGKLFMSPQRMGEVATQGTMMIAMLEHQKIPYTDPVTGEKKEKKYIDAWEVRDGVIELKPGFDPSWGRGGENFYKFKSKLHMINTRLQGAYDERVRPEMERYTIGKLAAFMRRYVVPSSVARYSPMRPYIAENTFREGYIISAIKNVAELIKTGGKSWNLMSDVDKKNMQKTMAEYGFSLMYYLVLTLMLGFATDDPDKFKKMRKMSYLEKIAIYELLMIKSETETFIFPSGLNEMLRLKNTPSVAFPMMDRYSRFGYHLIQLMADPFTEQNLSRYERKTGYFEKGDLKIFNDIMSLSGAKSYYSLYDPVTATKNYLSSINRQ